MQTKLELYQKVTPLAHLGIWERNLLTGDVYWNSVVREIYGVGPDFNPAIEASVSFYTEGDKLRLMLETAIKGGGEQLAEMELRTPSGQLKWVKVRIRAELQAGICRVIYGTLEDITAGVVLLRALGEQEQLFHHAFEFAPIGMALLSLEGGWIKVNQVLCTMLGYSEKELLSLTFRDITFPGDLEADMSEVARLLSKDTTSYHMDKRYLRKDGSIVWAALYVTLVRNRQGDPLYFVSQVKDISERKKHIELLSRESQRLDNILKSTQVGTWEWELLPDRMLSNKRAAAILGYEQEDFDRKPVKVWQDLIHPEDRRRNLRQLGLCFKQRTKFYAVECRMRHRDGSWHWVELRGKVVEWSGEGKPVMMLGTLADTHEKKLMELERARAMEVIRAQNDRLLNFAHIVSHNLRSHTSNIQLITNLIAEEQDPEEKAELLSMLAANASNLQETLLHLNDVVDVHAGSHQQLKRLNLRTETDKIVSTLAASLKQAGGRVAVDMDAGIMIDFDQSYLESILLNLLTNSIKYRDTAKLLRVDINAFIRPGKVVLEVRDNGVGIDLAVYGQKLFGMYKTFHGNEDARGVGLFLVKNQLESLGGRIEVDSLAGSGTLFRISFKND